MVNGRDCLIAGLVGVDAKCAGAIYVEGEVRGIDFESIVAVKMADAEVDRTKRKPQLGNVVPEIEKSHAGFRTQADGCGTNLNLCAGVSIDPKIVAYGQRAISHRIEPVAFAA